MRLEFRSFGATSKFSYYRTTTTVVLALYTTVDNVVNTVFMVT